MNHYRIHRRGVVTRNQQGEGLLFKESATPRVYRLVGDMDPYVDMLIDVVAVVWHDKCGWMQVERVSETPIEHFDDTFIPENE